jgi:hypothetical protein
LLEANTSKDEIAKLKEMVDVLSKVKKEMQTENQTLKDRASG